jgi:hypothetical protein
VSTPPGGAGQDPYGSRPRRGNPTPLVVLGVVVIAVCVVVLFALSGGSGSASPRLSADDCTTAEAQAVSCDAAEAAYRVLEAQEDVPFDAADAACAAVPGVVASYWQGGGEGPDTAYCLGPV